MLIGIISSLLTLAFVLGLFGWVAYLALRDMPDIT
jgi:hypothetical protein